MLEQGRIISNQKVARDIFCMELAAPEIAAQSAPGQFVNIRLGEKLEPLLRRPISLHDINVEKGSISMLYLVVGAGTKQMTKMKEGELLDVLGPLGNGFRLDFKGESAVLVGGGIGIAPLFPLARALRERGKSVSLAVGAKNEEFLMDLSAYQAIGVDTYIVTDDGSSGKQGFATDIMSELKENGKCDYVYACGPTPMLRVLEKIAEEKGISGQVSTESHMGCGLGVCLCCPNKVKKGGYKRTCVDGPVFEIGEIDYE